MVFRSHFELPVSLVVVEGVAYCSVAQCINAFVNPCYRVNFLFVQCVEASCLHAKVQNTVLFGHQYDRGGTIGRRWLDNALVQHGPYVSLIRPALGWSGTVRRLENSSEVLMYLD